MKLEEFQRMYETNVNGHTEERNGLTYLSWAWAWAEFKKQFPNATYEIEKFESVDKLGNKRLLPYMESDLGYMVMTKVTVDDLTHEMWLPVIDSGNKTLKRESYTIVKKDKYGNEKKTNVEAATMFDINKSIMRCLTKNLAMFGLGLYIYAGEDLPEIAPKPVEYITSEQLLEFDTLGIRIENTLKKYNITNINQLTKEDAQAVINAKKEYEKKQLEKQKNESAGQ